MKRLLVLLALLAMVLLPASPALGQSVVHVTGGGAGTFAQDLDGDGDIDGSRFGIGVVIDEGGVATGHFECLMAGASDILGLPLMAVEAKVTAGSADPQAGTAFFGGVARVNLANGTIFRDVPIQVAVTAGAAGTATMQLTVIGAFDGVPGDQIPSNGNYDLPTETVEHGRIDVH
jgi:hypothetical protein